MQVFTCPPPPNVQPLGIVAGESTMGVNVLKDITSGFQDMFGGKNGFVESSVTKARVAAVNKMIEEAQTLYRGAEYIFSARFQFTTVQGGQLIAVMAAGTACKLLPVTGGGTDKPPPKKAPPKKDSKSSKSKPPK